ncbi:MAG: hypothetical protein H7A32_02110 [Deltaproteobacteria bacterium]|nr:hypothetical protein [Deltaproteobacteria bacterium]
MNAQQKMDQVLENQNLDQAFELMAHKDFLAAEEELNEGLADAKFQEDANLEAVFYSAFGVLSKLKKDYQKAWEYYEAAEKILPNDPSLKLIVARLGLDIFGQTDSVIRRCKKVLEIASQDSEYCHQALTIMGIAYLNKGERHQAIRCLHQVMEAGFEDLSSANYIDLKLVEELIKKRVGLEDCRQYLELALVFAKNRQEEKHIELYSRLLDAFSPEEVTE